MKITFSDKMEGNNFSALSVLQLLLICFASTKISKYAELPEFSITYFLFTVVIIALPTFRMMEELFSVKITFFP